MRRKLYLLFAAVVMLAGAITGERSFIIDYANNTFLKDGHPFRWISGSVHYFRVPPQYWRDRMEKMKAAGLNAIEFYVPWNIHEPLPGQYEFSGAVDLTRFLDIIQELGFIVNMRLGPYTCGEWENGGLPWWLLKTSDIRMRTSDPRFLAPVKKWFDKLFPVILPYLYKNGGPIALIQVENEYGSRPMCDIKYKAFLRDLFRSYVGYDFVLVTVDGGGLSYLKCGFIPDVYPTVDFGTGSKAGVAKAFAAQRTYAPRGPLVNSEFYPGWLDLWGKNFSTVATERILRSMTYMYEMGASFNFYMFIGGTNFGYMNGGTSNPDPVITSYDYDAPLSEAGDPTPKYFAIRNHIHQLTGWPLPAHIPPASKKGNYGNVLLHRLGAVVDLLHVLSPRSKRTKSVQPLSMEQLNFPYGFVLYETVLKRDGHMLRAPGVKDRGYVMLDKVFLGVLVHQFQSYCNLNISINATAGQKLHILVENRGRKNDGYNDPKGLLPNVTLDAQVLTDWKMYPIQLEKVFSATKRRKTKPFFLIRRRTEQNKLSQGPSVYFGKFSTSQPLDTFFDPTGWSKGQFLINRYNVGRYWPLVGPQVTLYTPRPMLNNGNNYVLVLELENPGNCMDQATNDSCSISFTDRPFLNKPVKKEQQENEFIQFLF